MTGTTGNPINLAGFCLLTAWLGVVAVRRTETALWLRVVAESVWPPASSAPSWP